MSDQLCVGWSGSAQKKWCCQIIQGMQFNPLMLSTHCASVSFLVCMFVCKRISSGWIKAGLEQGLADTVQCYVPWIQIGFMVKNHKCLVGNLWRSLPGQLQFSFPFFFFFPPQQYKKHWWRAGSSVFSVWHLKSDVEVSGMTLSKCEWEEAVFLEGFFSSL